MQTTVTLEDRLFKSSIYLGIFATTLLLIYDGFFTREYISVVAEIFALFFFGINYYILQKRNSSNRHRFIFSVVLLVIIDYGWITGGGMSIFLASLLFLGVDFILVVNNARYYKLIILILLANYLILYSLEYFWQFNLSPSYATYKPNLTKHFITWFILFFFGGFFTVFLKVNYNRERFNLRKANNNLKEKSEEIINQNEKLRTSKEALDKTITKLDSQKKELIAIKGSLEDKVRGRTNDLLNLNERLLSQNQQLEQYAYITSHNLRAPIAQIKGLLHLLPLQADFDKLTKETFGRLEESAQNMEKVFSDLSTILNVKNGIQKPWENIELVSEIVGVVESLKINLEEKNIKIELPTQNSFIVKALRPYIYSVLHNIIENAVKYSDSNKTNSSIKIALSETTKYQKVSISDNGIGIDMDLASGKVFQMYQRFNNTHPGQGFGLFLVKTQMETMSGKVEVDSIFGQGTTFNLYFLKRH